MIAGDVAYYTDSDTVIYDVTTAGAGLAASLVKNQVVTVVYETATSGIKTALVIYITTQP